MSNYAKLYWLTRLDTLHHSFFILCILSIVAFGIYCLFNVLENRESPSKKILRWFIPVWVFLLLGTMFTPTKNELIFIIAGGKAINYVQSDTSLSKIPYQTTTIISEYLDKQIKEIKEGK